VKCLFQHCVKHRREVTGRGVDDLQDLSGRGLALHRLVTLGFALGKLTFEIGDLLLGIGENAVGCRARVCGPRRDPSFGRIIP
jgi:hypothetical protein